jgi:hypothetical protein
VAGTASSSWPAQHRQAVAAVVASAEAESADPGPEARAASSWLRRLRSCSELGLCIVKQVSASTAAVAAVAAAVAESS